MPACVRLCVYRYHHGVLNQAPTVAVTHNFMRPEDAPNVIQELRREGLLDLARAVEHNCRLHEKGKGTGDVCTGTDTGASASTTQTDTAAGDWRAGWKGNSRTHRAK